RKFDAQPYFWPCEDNQMQNEAKESFQSMKDMQVIWAWIEKHLDDEQKKRIYSALRAKSSRKNNVNKTRVVSLTLTSEEYMRLLALTNDDDLKTVGDVIKKQLFT
ncbi:MAG: hypothetical protein Q9M28_00710, partial [Mariprofundaceae bacterium]|nr:hypothetical protein [Mariprofundaceae bacterium]